MVKNRARSLGGLPPEIVSDLNLRSEGRLISILGTHGERESAALDAYRLLAEESDDEGVRYLTRLILDDEKRHHALIDEMLHTVRAFVEDVDLAPSAPFRVGPIGDELAGEVESLRDFEKSDLAELKALRKALKDDSSYPLLLLLVSLIEQDTRKHIDILEFIRAHGRH